MVYGVRCCPQMSLLLHKVLAPVTLREQNAGLTLAQEYQLGE